MLSRSLFVLEQALHRSDNPRWDAQRNVRRTIFVGLATASIAWGLTVAVAGGQVTQRQQAPMVEDVFKNVQILKGIPVDRFMATLGFLSASLGVY